MTTDQTTQPLDLDAIRQHIADLVRQRDHLHSAILTAAAECHRRKWAHTDNSAAFDELHRMGEILRPIAMAPKVAAPVPGSSPRAPEPDRPRVVVLCGSTRFGHSFREANLRETLAGRIVLSIGFDIRSDAVFADLSPDKISQIKADVDELHKRKIDMADEVLVLNVGGYVGDSTRSEIEYAQRHGKPIRWLEHAVESQSSEPAPAEDIRAALNGEATR